MRPKIAMKKSFIPRVPRNCWFVYLIKLDRPLGTDKHQARYYLGSTNNLKRRMHEHRSSIGAAMLRAANERGIGYEIIKWVWVEDQTVARLLECRLKAMKNHALLVDRDWTALLAAIG